MWYATCSSPREPDKGSFAMSIENQKSMRTTIGLAAILAGLASLAGCAAPSGDEPAGGDEASDSQDVVGITDLAVLERSLGLTPATAQNRGNVESGACYAALIASGPGYPVFEFRRYANGAAFWAKKGSGYNSGDQRPVLCVDVAGPNGGVSLSGVALDAVIRYDLGKLVGQDSGMQKTHLVFEHGNLHFSNYDVTEQERLASVQRRPHELPFANASTIEGRLRSVDIDGVTVKAMFDGTSTRSITMDGDVAYFIYRHAWRKGEETGRFTVADDAIGKFVKTAEVMGDGPGYAETWSFARGSVVYSKMGEFPEQGPGSTVDEISFRPTNAAPGQPPAAECSRRTIDEQPSPGYECTGL